MLFPGNGLNGKAPGRTHRSAARLDRTKRLRLMEFFRVRSLLEPFISAADWRRAHAEALGAHPPVRILSDVGRLPRLEKSGAVNTRIRGFTAH